MRDPAEAVICDLVLGILCFMFVFFFILGTIMGSFANALIFRFGHNRPILEDQRSYCDHCGKKLLWYELIPIVSFIALLGRCSGCKQRIAPWTLVVELCMGLGFVLAAVSAGTLDIVSIEYIHVARFVFVALFVFACVFFFIIDWLYMIIPDQVSLPLIALGTVGSIILEPGGWRGVVLAGILGGSFFLAQFVFSRGRWIGDGDIRLGVLLGVFLGVQHLLVALMLAYSIGMMIALALLASRRFTLKSRIPFGAILMVAGGISFWYGNHIVHWYLYDAPLLLLRLWG